MKRAQMVSKVTDMLERPPFGSTFHDDATAIVDFLLPQVTTVEELEALPRGTALLYTSDSGATLFQWETGGRSGAVGLWNGIYRVAPGEYEKVLPLTVVWQP